MRHGYTLISTESDTSFSLFIGLGQVPIRYCRCWVPIRYLSKNLWNNALLNHVNCVNILKMVYFLLFSNKCYWYDLLPILILCHWNWYCLFHSDTADKDTCYQCQHFPIQYHMSSMYHYNQKGIYSTICIQMQNVS